jgi:hypothetical protein
VRRVNREARNPRARSAAIHVIGLSFRGRTGILMDMARFASTAIVASVLAVASMTSASACGAFTAESSPDDGGARGNDGSVSGGDSGAAADGGGDPGALDSGKAHTGYRATVMADGPLGYWRLGESPGTTRAHDETGNFDGTYMGNCTLGVPGVVANETAVHFNGTDCTVDLGDHFEFTGISPFSIEAWVKPATPQPEFVHVFTREVRATSPISGYALLFDDPTSAAVERAVSANNRKTGGAAVPLGAFAHVVATYDGSQLRVYVNGIPAGGGAADATPMPAMSVHAFIGSAGGGDNFFKGDIDEVAVYGKALGAGQVQGHFDAVGK